MIKPKAPDKPNTKRTHIILVGRVQGVGFRYTVQNWGKALGLQGWVANRIDGGVEIVAEGGKNSIEKLILKLNSSAPGRIDKCIVNYEIPTGEFIGFEVRY